MRFALRQNIFSGCVVCATCSLSASLPAGLLFAQEQATGPRSSIRLSVGASAGKNLEFDTGGDDTSLAPSSALRYDFIRETRRTALNFQANLDWADDDLTTGLDLGYRVEGARSNFVAGASYSQSDVSDLAVTVDDAGDVITFDSDGTREVSRLSLRYQGGMDLPVGYSAALSFTELSYSDTDAFDDTQNVTGRFGLRFSPNSSIDYNLELTLAKFDADDVENTKRDTESLTASASYRLDASQTLSGTLGYSTIKTEELGITEDVNGATAAVSYTREDSVGIYGVELSSTLSGAGRRDALTLARSAELPNATWDVMLGVSQGEEGGATLIGRVGYQMSLQSDRINLSLDRRVSTNGDNEDVTVTALRGGYTHQLSEISALGLSVTANVTDNPVSGDSERFDASLAYERELARDVQIELGVRNRYGRNSNDDIARSQELFFSLSKTFDTLH